ncbi:peritrophin-48 [Musca autumnalis]|uniref:peritrophin-48 n=1 Tax=Musca autumnalis TaxID=221902 RepID=UPI003CF3FA2D
MKSVFTLPTLLVCLGILYTPALGANIKWSLVSDEDVCSLFPNGAQLRKPGSCQETIVCQDGKSTEGTSCTGTQGFKLDGGKCASVTDSYCSHGCTKNSPTWIGATRNCIDWYQCDGSKQVSSGTCPTKQVFNPTLEKCQYPDADFVCDKVYDICDITPTNTKIWDEDNCHKYFECSTKQALELKSCPTGLYYDKRSGQCIAKAQVECYKHPIPEGVCGNAKLAIRDRFVRDQATCNGYFYCQDKGSGIPDTNPTWGSCTKSYFFDEDLQACRPRTEVACTEDRCVGRPSGFELAPIEGCQHYLNCVNGYTLGEPIKCEDDKYFDAATEECVATKKSYPICS